MRPDAIIAMMLGVTPKRLLVMVFVAALFFTSLQYIPAFLYAWEFEDFVRDEVKFAPVRENLEEEKVGDHLVEHILEEARFYQILLDRKDIRVSKTRDPERGVSTISVDIDYKMPVDLYYFVHDVPFHYHAAQYY